MVTKDAAWMMWRGIPIILLGQIFGFAGFKIADFFLLH